MKQSKVIEIIYLIILIVNLGFQLYPNLESGLNGNTEFETFTNYYQLKLALFNALGFFIILLFNNTYERGPIIILVLLLEFFYLISIIAGGLNNTGLSFITTPLSYFTIFCVLFRYKINNNISSLIFITLLIWCILPIVLLVVWPIEMKLKLFSGDGVYNISTFRGFAIHRNVYGFYAGLSIILLFFVNIKWKWRAFLYLFLLLGIILSESRTSILLAIAVPAYFYSQKKQKSKIYKFIFLFSSVIILISIFVFLTVFKVRSGSLLNYQDRNELLFEYADIFINNPLFGTGGILKKQEGFPVHNFIIQVLANYGIFTGFTFFALIYFIWNKGSLYFKTLFLYLLIFGLFQPYFNFGPISKMSLILILTAISYNHKENEIISIFPSIKINFKKHAPIIEKFDQVSHNQD